MGNRLLISNNRHPNRVIPPHRVTRSSTNLRLLRLLRRRTTEAATVEENPGAPLRNFTNLNLAFNKWSM
jgi:hypothetical protein